MPDLDTRTATSADGTAVEYLSTGDGPPVIVVHGAIGTAASLAPFAAFLAARHTVHLVQRRGRGGAVAVHEPAVSVNGSIPADWTGRASREITAGTDFEAFITFIRGVNPDQTGRVPRRLLRVMLKQAIPRAEMRQNLTVMPQVITEHGEVGRLDGRLADYRAVAAPALIMRGKGRDTSRQAAALAQLAETIPHAEAMTFPRLNHFAPEKKPGKVAEAVLRFFAAHTRPDTELNGATGTTP